MHTLSVVRPEAGGAHSARTAIAILFFAFLTACGGGGDDSGGSPDAAPAAPGSLDASFSTDGIATTAIGTDSTSALAVGLQSDGKIVVAGSATNDGINHFFAIARYNSDGTLDTTFDTDGIVTTIIPGTTSSSAAALGLQTDGKIVVAGTADGNIALARYNSDGGLDTTFDTDGIVTTTTIGTGSSALALGLQTDGKIVVTGNATIGGVENFVVVRYNANGSLDTTFDADGIITTSIGTSSNAFALAMQSDGKIVAAGKADSGATENIALARYNTGGSLDTTFDFDGIVTTAFAANSVAFALALQPDGKIVVAGNAGGEIVVVRYTSSGALDTTFSTVGFVITPIGIFASASALALQSDGKVVVAGTADAEFVLARYNSNGTSDTSFGSGGIVTTAIGTSASASALALQSSDGKIVVAGSSDGSIALARYNP
jgi:uncharacterized delta-60 repeat protein